MLQPLCARFVATEEEKPVLAGMSSEPGVGESEEAAPSSPLCLTEPAASLISHYREEGERAPPDQTPGHGRRVIEAARVGGAFVYLF